MQQDNFDIDNKLRQLEKQSLPDLSKMDEHWQTMQRTIQSTPTFRVRTILKWSVAAMLAGAAFLLVYQYSSQNKKSTPDIAQSSPGQIKSNVDTTKKRLTINNRKDTAVYQLVGTYSVSNSKSGPSRSLDSAIIRYPSPVIKFRDTIIYHQIPANKPVLPETNKQALLSDFFKQLEKPAQEFVINNDKDTIISARDGSSFFIPAYTFQGKKEITITVKEYFTYEDIVTNKLTTLSNGQLLETGGMIHIKAEAEGKEVNITPGKKIRWFIPDTSAAIKQMQLFTGETSQNSRVNRIDTFFKIFDNGRDVLRDTLTSARNSGINWIAQERKFTNSGITTLYKVLDLKNDPYKVKTNDGKKKAFFYLGYDSKLTKEQLADSLKRKYDYDKVVVKKVKDKRGLFPGLFGDYERKIFLSLGDTISVEPYQAAIYRLTVLDTIRYVTQGMAIDQYQERWKLKMNLLSQQYSVDLSTLGWINCDRFINDRRIKLNYAVELKENANDYFTVLVFDKMKSIMDGQASGNSIVFYNVPEGETARVVCVGIKDGKLVSAMETVRLSRAPLTTLNFEGTNPASFKQDVKELDQ